ncbi:MAG: hypothetical protein JWM27_2761 [Gemmatimonadetes bacterium]|nr:hypothetical protein [Gemmatimonadota bacterium]
MGRSRRGDKATAAASLFAGGARRYLARRRPPRGAPVRYTPADCRTVPKTSPPKPSAVPPSPPARPAVIACGLALLHLLLAAAAFNPTPHVGGDSGTYRALARSLLERHAYVDLWDPALPPHTQYPPVFPLLVAGWTALGFGSWTGMKVLVLLFSCAAVAASWLWLRQVTAPKLALAVGLVMAAAPGVLDLSHWELSDVPFWFFTALALWAFARFDAAGRHARELPAAGRTPSAASSTSSASGPVDSNAAASNAAASTGAVGPPASVAAGGRGKRRPPSPPVADTGVAGGKAARPRGAKSEASPEPSAAPSVREEAQAGHPTRWLVLAAAAVAVADLTRAAGLPLVLAAGVWLLLRHGWRRAALYAAVAGPGIAAWWLRGRALGGGYTGFLWYADPYRPAMGMVTGLGMLQRIWENTTRYATEHLPMLLAGVEVGLVLGVAVGMAVAALALVGWARRLRRPGLPEIWLPLYMGVLLMWPVTWSGERLVLPILPLLLLYAGEALRDVLAMVAGRKRLPAAAAWVAIAALLLGMLPGVAGVVRVGASCAARYAAGEAYPCMDAEFVDFMSMAAALRGRLPAGSVVLSRKPTLFFAQSGYPSRTYPLTADPDSFFRVARAARARYVVVDQIADLAPMYLQPILLARRDEFCVFREPFFPNAALARIEAEGSRERRDAPPNSFRQCTPPLPKAPPGG